MQKRIKDEMKLLREELVMKDELLQKLHNECKELKRQLINSQKKEDETNILNSELLSQQV